MRDNNFKENTEYTGKIKVYSRKHYPFPPLGVMKETGSSANAITLGKAMYS